MNTIPQKLFQEGDAVIVVESISSKKLIFLSKTEKIHNKHGIFPHTSIIGKAPGSKVLHKTRHFLKFLIDFLSKPRKLPHNPFPDPSADHRDSGSQNPNSLRNGHRDDFTKAEHSPRKSRGGVRHRYFLKKSQKKLDKSRKCLIILQYFQRSFRKGTPLHLRIQQRSSRECCSFFRLDFCEKRNSFIKRFLRSWLSSAERRSAVFSWRNRRGFLGFTKTLGSCTTCC